ITWTGGSATGVSSPYNISPLNAGTYTITVTDANGSFATTTATVQNLPVTNTSTNFSYATIQKAIDAPATVNGNIITVCAGTYAENVVVSKELDIRGPNYTATGCSTRVAEAIVVPAVSAVSSGEIFHVAASNVSISGFTIDGDNTSLTSGILGTNSADIDAAEGITVYEDNVNNLTATNNIIKNLSYFGITVFGAYDPTYPFAGHGIPSSGHTISGNKMLTLGTYDPASGIDRWGGGVLLYENQYAAVTNNCMDSVRIGVQTGNYYRANPGAASFQVIDGNTMTNVRRTGVFHNLAYSNASAYTVSNNTITGVANANETKWDGVELASLSVASTTSANIINAAAVPVTQASSGIEVWNVKSTTPATITGGSVTAASTAIFVNNYDGYSSDATDGAYATISNITLTPSVGGTGIRVLDNTLSSHAIVSAAIGSGVVINNGANGLIVENTSAIVPSLANPAFTGQTGDYIKLINNANNIDATAATFNGNTGASATLPQNFAIEDKISHKIDLLSLGFVLVKAGEDFVTVNSFVAPNTTAKIQRAVDASSNGFIVNVAPGTFVDNVIVDKDVTIIGGGQGITTVLPATSNPMGGSLGNPVFLVRANGVTIDDLTVDGKNPAITGAADIDASTGIITDWSAGDYTNLEVFNVTVMDVYLRGLQAANSVSGSNTFNFHNNIVNGVKGDPASIGIFNYGDAGTITNNTISNANAGIQTNYSIGTTINSNTVTGIAGSTGIESDNSGGAGGTADVISSNTINDGANGVFVFQPTLTVGVDGNNITNYTAGGVTAAGRDGSGSVSITNNDINGMSQAAATGILVTTADIGFGTMDANVTATNNFVRNNGVDGFKIEKSAGKTVTLNAHYNSITGNANKNAEITGTGTSLANMTCNWWGSADPATVAAGISGSIVYSPFLSTGTDDAPLTQGFQPVPNSCTAICTVNIALDNATSPTCFGSNNGSINVTVTAGSGNYSYVWTGSNMFSSSSEDLSGLFAGTYDLTVNDINSGCTATLPTVTLTSPDPLVGNIGGTATVAQSLTATSPITFSATGGTKPYTFTYKVNNGTPVNVSTTGMNSSVQVQQSQLILGQYIYELTAVTDANGCIGSLPTDNKDTVTVVATIPRPDLYSSVTIVPNNSQFYQTEVKEGYITLSNASVSPTTGAITFRVSNMAGFNLVLSNLTTMSGGQPVDNVNWTFVPGAFSTTITSNPGVIIGGSPASIKIGYQLTATGAPGSSAVMTVGIINGTGGSTPLNGDSNDSNNSSVKLFSIN
ncbi:MAG: hypothetical protein ABIX01_13880, partial [Chitinophagaceae bacterium]